MRRWNWGRHKALVVGFEWGSIGFASRKSVWLGPFYGYEMKDWSFHHNAAQQDLQTINAYARPGFFILIKVQPRSCFFGVRRISRDTHMVYLGFLSVMFWQMHAEEVIHGPFLIDHR